MKNVDEEEREKCLGSVRRWITERDQEKEGKKLKKVKKWKIQIICSYFLE